MNIYAKVLGKTSNWGAVQDGISSHGHTKSTVTYKTITTEKELAK